MNRKAIKVRAKVEDGTIRAPEGHLRAFWERVTRQMTGTIEITVKPLKSNRSLSQNAYYWGVILPCMADGFYDATGERYSAEEIHDFMKGKFLPARSIADPETGLISEVKGSTAGLYKDEFGEYLDQLIKWSAEFLHIVIPEAR